MLYWVVKEVENSDDFGDSSAASATPALHTFAVGSVVWPVSRRGLTVTPVTDLQVLTRCVVTARALFLALVYGWKTEKYALYIKQINRHMVLSPLVLCLMFHSHFSSVFVFGWALGEPREWNSGKLGKISSSTYDDHHMTFRTRCLSFLNMDNLQNLAASRKLSFTTDVSQDRSY